MKKLIHMAMAIVAQMKDKDITRRVNSPSSW
jgi:hypothetical protein